jgi:hypothetical protein
MLHKSLKVVSHKKSKFEENLTASQLTLLKMAEVAEILNATHTEIPGTYIDRFFKKAKNYIDR